MKKWFCHYPLLSMAIHIKKKNTNRSFLILNNKDIIDINGIFDKITKGFFHFRDLNLINLPDKCKSCTFYY